MGLYHKLDVSGGVCLGVPAHVRQARRVCFGWVSQLGCRRLNVFDNAFVCFSLGTRFWRTVCHELIKLRLVFCSTQAL